MRFDEKFQIRVLRIPTRGLLIARIVIARNFPLNVQMDDKTQEEGLSHTPSLLLKV